jgi:hypothetical protein
MVQTNKFFRLSFSVMAVLGLVFGLVANSTLNTHAAGVTVTVAPSAQAVSTAGNVVLTFTTTAAIPVGGTVQVLYPTAAYTGTATFAITGATGTVANTTSGSNNVSTFTVTTTPIAAGAITATIGGLTTSATAGNNTWIMYTSAGDYGANFQYVGQANVVSVRARVPLQLAFAIRNTGDTANTNVCDMGDLTTSAVGFCEYRLKVTTNARSGYTINVATSGNFTNGTDNFANAAVGTGGAGGTAQAAGTELYGVKVTKGSITGAAGTTTLATVYDAGATNNVSYVAAGPATLITANKPNSPATTDLTNTTLVRHEAGISANTAAGLYTQTVTYTIAPSF